MAQNQSFLPVLATETRTILGMVAISTTTFVGDEEGITLGVDPNDVEYPLIKYTPKVSQPTSFPWYMALPQTHAQVKAEEYRSFPGFIALNEVLPGQWWTSSAIGPQKNENLGAIINGLLWGFGGQFDVTVEDDPDVDDSDASLVWVASVPFANAPQCTSFDLNWVEAVQLENQGTNPVFLTIQSVTDGADGAQSKVRAVVVAVGQPALNRATYNTVRLVKMPNQVILAGDEFKINATVNGQNGFSETVQIQVTII